jgi:hypothetical protein
MALYNNYNMLYNMVRLEKQVNTRIDNLGSCGMTKSQVIERLIDFFEMSKNAVMKISNKKSDDSARTESTHDNEVCNINDKYSGL